jgi:hypothetical protein
MSRRISKNKVLLIFIFLATLSILVTTLLFFSYQLFHARFNSGWKYPVYIILGFSLLTFIYSIIDGYLFLKKDPEIGAFSPGKLLGVVLASIKYKKNFPLWFVFDRQASPPLVAESKLPVKLKPGDILLRRHDAYLDGLVLQQASYFTHAALYYGNANGNGTGSILHATSDKGVHFIGFEKFVNCDSLAVIRFREDGITLVPPEVAEIFEPEVKGSVFSNVITPIDEGTVLDLIKEGKDLKELLIYNNVKEAKSRNDVITLDADYKYTILKIGKKHLGAKYDGEFSFLDSEKLSCVELVWHAYKCLFPLHLVRDKVVSYFSLVKPSVIVPDDFLRSSAFDLVYTTIDNSAVSREQLIRHVDTNRFNFWGFLVRFIGMQLLILLAIYLLVRVFVF